MDKTCELPYYFSLFTVNFGKMIYSHMPKPNPNLFFLGLSLTIEYIGEDKTELEPTDMVAQPGLVKVLCMRP